MSLANQINWLDHDNRRLAERLFPTQDTFSLDYVRGNVQLTTDVPGSVIAAPGANTRIVLTDIMVTCGSASVGTYVEITDGNGGTVLWKGYAAAGGGGFAVALKSPLLLTANTALFAKCVTDASDVWVSASGYKGSTVTVNP